MGFHKPYELRSYPINQPYQIIFQTYFYLILLLQ